MRLFVAVLPPVVALQGLSDAVTPVRGLPGADRLRWTTVEGWHLTLALSLIHTDVAEVHPVHRLRIAGAGRFGDRVLWAGVEGQTWALRRLAEAVAEATAEVTAETTDAFAFHPHLTLARAGSARGHRRAVQRVAAAELEGLAAALADYRGPEWEAAELHLMRSELDGGRTHYESLRSWALADWS